MTGDSKVQLCKPVLKQFLELKLMKILKHFKCEGH